MADCDIADGLTTRGLTVRATGGDDDSRLLKVTGTGAAACDLVLADDDEFTCEYTPGGDVSAGPADIARVVARMLGAEYTSAEQYAHLRRGVTPAGAVGREMKARGMSVALSVIEDNETYSVYACVVIANPARPGRGKVHIEGCDWVYWEGSFDELAGGPAELAGAVADVLALGGPGPEVPGPGGPEPQVPGPGATGAAAVKGAADPRSGWAG